MLFAVNLSVFRVFYKQIFQGSNATLSYYDNLTESNKALVFIHGWLESKENLLKFAELLNWNYRMILPDLRGHGESSCPSGRYTLDEFSSDVVELIKSILPPNIRVILIGRSMGGMVIASIYEKIKDSCESLIFLNSSLKFKAYNFSAYFLDTFIPYLLLIDSTKLTRFARLTFGLYAPQNELNLVKQTLNRANKKVGYLAYRNSISKVDLLHIVRDAPIPVLSVGGGLDTVLPSGHSKDIARIAKHGKYRFFATCGHFSNIEFPGSLEKTIWMFIKSYGG